MKVTIEFELPEDAIDLRHAIDATKAFSLISELDRQMRALQKHGTQNEETLKVVTELRGLILEELHGFPEGY